MDIKIEVLQEKDWERYKAIRLASLRDSPDAFVTTLAQSESWPQETWQRSITSTMTTMDPLITRGVPKVTGLGL